MNYGKLVYTGLGTVTIGGVVFNQWALLGIAAGLVAVGALLIRYAWRRGRKVGAR